MSRQEAFAAAEKIIELIRADRNDEARTIFADIWASLYPEIEVGKPLADMKIFFYELDEYLHNTHAVQSGFITKGLLTSSFLELSA